MAIRYEDFVENPVEMYRKIAEHFNLELTEKVETQINNMVDSGRQEKWKRLDKDVLKRCLPILKDEMEKHGYDTSSIEQFLAD